jgi:hypothetical protein
MSSGCAVRALADSSIQEVALARERMRLEGRKGREPFSRAKLRKILLSWHLPILVVMYM